MLILCNIGRSRLPWIPSATCQRRWDVETPCPTTRIIVTVSFGGDALNDEIRSVGAAVSACKCGCDDRRAQSAPASDPRRSGTEGGTGPRRALYSPVSSRRSGLTRRGSRARSPNVNSNHRREHAALRFRNQSLECGENCETCSLWYLTMPSSSLVVVEDSIEQRISARNMLFRNP